MFSRRLSNTQVCLLQKLFSKKPGNVRESVSFDG
jgi:hypothetical protein